MDSFERRLASGGARTTLAVPVYLSEKIDGEPETICSDSFGRRAARKDGARGDARRRGACFNCFNLDGFALECRAKGGLGRRKRGAG
jgi:hypothetical protein